MSRRSRSSTGFRGVYKDTRPENFFPRFATDPVTLFDVFPEYQLSPAELESWKSERDAFIAGRTLAENQGWEIGDRISIKGDIYPVDLDLVLRGIFEDPDNETNEQQMFFHRPYLQEAMGNQGTVNNFWLRIDDPENAPAVITAAEKMFENSSAQVRAETAEAFALSFMQMMGNVQFLFGAIGAAIVVSILLITANTMAMAARERTSEVAVLRTLGFRKPQVVTMVIVESVIVGLLGALLGVGLAAVVLPIANEALRSTPLFIGELTVAPIVLSIALGVGLAIGLIAGAFPAGAAARLQIVDGLRRV